MENLEEILSKIRSSSKLDFLIFDNYKKILHHPQDDVETLKLLLELGTLAIPLEYIGKKQIDGTKLYVGDIIKYQYKCDILEGVLDWYGDSACDIFVIHKHKLEYQLIDKDNNIIPLYNKMSHHCFQKIGNIFENPNLLYNEI